MKKSKLVVLIGLCLAFCNVVRSMDNMADLSMSTFNHGIGLAKAKYEKLKSEATSDKSKLLMQHIAAKSPEDQPYLISSSFSDALITPADLLFVVQQTNFSNQAKEENKKTPFDYVIGDRLRTKPKQVAPLLGEVCLTREPSYFQTWSATKNYQLKTNVLGYLVEEENFKALEAILLAWPDSDVALLANPLTATFTVKDTSSGYLWHGSKPESKDYSLIEWIDYKISIGAISDQAQAKHICELILAAQEPKKLPEKSSPQQSDSQSTLDALADYADSEYDDSGLFGYFHWSDLANIVPWPK